MDSSYTVAIIGQNNSTELIPVIDYLTQDSSSFLVEFFEQSQQFFDAVSNNLKCYDLILVLQNRPREYSSVVIEQLIAVAPLSRIICSYSSWSESDGRNDPDLWPVSCRVPARATIPAIRKAIAIIEGQKGNIPFTAGREEVYFGMIPESLNLDNIHSNQTIYIESPDLEFKLMLYDLVRELNHHLEITENRKNASICLWDADPFNEMQLNQLRDFQNQNAQTIIIPLMNFPQPEESLQLQTEFHSTEVIPKLQLTNFLPDFLVHSILKS